MTTWRLESMWTRTLSTTISTSPSSMPGLSHGRRCRRSRWGGGPAARADRHDQLGEQRAHDEPADVGEERDPTGLHDAQRGEPVDELQDEPEAEHEDGGNVDELIEEAEEHERRDPSPREEDEVGAERCCDRARRTDRRDGRARVDGDLREAGEDPAEQVEAEEAGPPETILDVVAEDPQVEHVAEQVEPATVQELAGDERRGLLRQVVATGPGRRQVCRDHAPALDERLERGVAATREEAELPGEPDEAGDDQRQRDVRRPPRRIGVPQGDHGSPDQGFLGFGVAFTGFAD